ncbi:MAG: hypothetical protein KC609_13970, partial [Myxococcales bacterium]|nr:hypothetical protein [Myxococcales bacterium]
MQLTRHEIDNFVRWNPASERGHYESFFLKANDPQSRRALWLKFTILSPVDQPDHAVSEVWAIAFDGDRDHHVAVKRRQPVERSKLGFNRFALQMADCELAPARTKGSIERGAHRVEWDLTFLTEQQESLHPFPFERMYEMGFPKAKLKTPYPDSRFNGRVRVDGEEWTLEYWKGMQGHNWGVRHTDHYLWLHCNAFDGLDDTYLEGASAKLKLGPVHTPYLTFFCLVHRGKR